MNTTTRSLETLLEHRSWVHALARQLVHDPDAAADLEQETWLEAVRRPPRDLGNPKGWLATVLRNKARGLGRATSRRQRHESARPPADPAASAAKVAEHAEAQARLSRTVLQMAEPYRTVLLLRYFDDQSPRAIARTLGRPVATVGTQITRGLALLRRELDAEYGDRKSWLVAIVPLTGYGAPGAGGTVVLAATALILAGLGTWGLGTWGLSSWGIGPWDSGPQGTGSASTGSPAAQVAAVPPDPASPTPTPEWREAQAPVSGTSAAADPRPLFAGELRTLDGEPLPGMTIEFVDPDHPVREELKISMGSFRLHLHPSTIHRYRDAKAVGRLHPDCPDPVALVRLVKGETIPLPTVVSDPRGQFRIRGPRSTRRLRLTDPKHLILGVHKTEDGKNLVLVAPRGSLAGQILDPLGRPVQGASARIVADPVTLSKLTETPTVYSELNTFEQQTAEDGSFAFADFPRHAALSISIAKHGYATRRIPTVGITSSRPRWTLIENAEWRRRRVAGRVVRADGTPAVDAKVTLGPLEHPVDARGAFDFVAGTSDFGAPLIAVERGSQPATLEGLAERVRHDKTGAANLVLRLGPAPRTVRGRVVDAAGQPIAKMNVVVLDATLVGKSALQTVETLMADAPRSPIQTSDAEGRFALQLRTDRGYRIRAYRPRSLLVIDGSVSPTATELELRAPVDPFFAEVTGRLVTENGLPLANVSLAVTREIVQRGHIRIALRAEKVETDETGRFCLQNVPRHDARIAILSPGFESADYPVTGRQLLLTARPLLRFRIEVSEHRVANGFEIHGRDGKRLAVRRRDRPGQIDQRIALPDPDLPERVLMVARGAREIVFFQGDKEVGREPLSLGPGVVPTLRY